MRISKNTLCVDCHKKSYGYVYCKECEEKHKSEIKKGYNALKR